MRRILAGLIAFVAMTATLLVLPVYAAPAPASHAVPTSIDEVSLGSVADPAAEAVVTTDGEVVDDPSTGPPVGTPAETTPATEAPATEAPVTEAPATPGDEEVVTSGDELPGVPALTLSEPDTGDFSSVGVTWAQDPGVTDVVAQIRVLGVDGTWGGWTTLEPDDIEQSQTAETAGNDVRGGTAPYWTGPARGIEVIVQGADGAQPQDVQLALLDPGTSSGDSIPATPAVQDQAEAGTSMPTIISRAQWGADESIRGWDPEYAPTIKAATIHHTADGNDYTAAQVPAMMRSIYAYHTLTRGWGDIGYNVIVDKYGRIFEGRYGGLTSTVIGAHAGGFNSGTFGVSMLGNYAEVDTPQAMLDAVAAVIAWKLALYGVDPRGTTQLTSGGGGTSRYAAGVVVTLPTVFAHRDVGSTTCPGQYAYARMGQIREMVAARMSPATGSPIGNAETLSVTRDRLDLVGWALDPDQPSASIDVGISVDGGWALQLRADRSRPDVAAYVPGAGAAHGYSGSLGLAPGKHSICIVFVNAGATGSHTWARCQQVTATAPPPPPLTNPIGNVETVLADGPVVRVSGWTVDPDSLPSSLDVHVYVNDQFSGVVVAGDTRTDVAAAYPGAGPAHGFSFQQTFTAPGLYRVCLYAINVAQGNANPLLSCGLAVVPTAVFAPRGHLDEARVDGRSVQLSGWTFDVDAPTQSLEVHLYADGRFVRAVTADSLRTDVGAAFAGVGDSHGYSASMDLAPGTHDVCAYALNAGPGVENPLLGCSRVSISARAWEPIGNLDLAQPGPGGQVQLAGWAWDPDAGTSAVFVHVYVDGQFRGSFSAGGSRPDVAALFPAAGPGHGFATTLTAGPGTHTVCAYGINVGTGSLNQPLACRQVTV